MGKKKLLDESCSDSELGEERVSDYKADFNDDLDHEDQLFADPYGRRARSYLSKEEHIYGVFYEHPKDRIKPKDTLKTTTFYAGVKFTKEETINEFDEDACEKMDIDPPEGVHTKSSRNTAQKSSRFNKDFGAWEKYTDGIGSKLMSKMGYIRGQGLGKNSQGILEAVRTYQRGDRSGLGSGRSAKQDSPIEAVPDKPQRKNRWKRGSKNKDIYQAARDLIENAEYIEVSTEPMRIIDATGKEMVECNDLSQVFYKDEDLPLVEFRHNTRLLANMARNDLVKFSKKIKEQESAVKAIEEHINLISSVDVPDIDKLKGLLKVCYAIKSECDSLISVESELEIRDRLSSYVHELITEYYEEYKKQKMDSFVVGCLGSLLKTRFSFWDISNNQFLFYELLKSLLPLFLLSPNKAPEKVSVFDEVVSETWKMSFFETLIWTIWFPQVRRYLQNEWDVKDPIAAINFWDKWCEDVFQESKVHHISVIPKWLYDHAINTLIIPKINFFLENCVLTPADLSVLHTWIYPWLSHFHDNGDSIIDHASKKVVGSMGKFNINNDSLFKFMCNWSIILKPGIFNSIIRNNVLPKLAQYIRTEVIINPANQDLLPIQNVLIWDKVVPRDLMVNLLEVEFFPKWFKVLEIWLKAPNTNNEILIWLNSWKNLFNDFSKERGIINMFSAAECAIKQVTIDHIDIGKDGLYMPPPTASDENSESFKPQTGKYAGNFLVDDYFNDSTLAEYVETVVSSYNLIFISDPNGEYHKCTGKLLYRLTVASSSKRKYKPLLCYIDDCVMFSRPPNASLYDLWEPVSIEEACGQALEVAFSKES